MQPPRPADDPNGVTSASLSSSNHAINVQGGILKKIAKSRQEKGVRYTVHFVSRAFLQDPLSQWSPSCYHDNQTKTTSGLILFTLCTNVLIE